MEITVNVEEATPVYEQIIAQVCEAASTGKLAIGSMLPSVRQLAADLEINPNTVAKAYQILERNGVIQTAGRKGTFLSKNALENIDRTAEAKISQGLRSLIEEARDTGISKTKLTQIFSDLISNANFGS